MTDGTELPDVTGAEIILRKRAPQLLEQLQEVDAKEGFDDRVTLGEALPGHLPSPTEWRRAARYMEKALEVAIDACGGKIDGLRRALRDAGRWQLTADIIAVIGPASIFSVLKADHPLPAQYLSAGVTLLASIVAVAARYAARSPLNAGNLLDQYRELVDCRGRATALKRELTLNLKASKIGPQQQDLLTQANAVCGRVDTAID